MFAVCLAGFSCNWAKKWWKKWWKKRRKVARSNEKRRAMKRSKERPKQWPDWTWTQASGGRKSSGLVHLSSVSMQLNAVSMQFNAVGKSSTQSKAVQMDSLELELELKLADNNRQFTSCSRLLQSIASNPVGHHSRPTAQRRAHRSTSLECICSRATVRRVGGDFSKLSCGLVWTLHSWPAEAAGASATCPSGA